MSVYKRALNLWGLQAQLSLCQEECAELISAISKYKRRRTNSFPEMLEEIADVEIMLKQIKLAVLIGLDKNMLKNIKSKKLKRLEKRLSK